MMDIAFLGQTRCVWMRMQGVARRNRNMRIGVPQNPKLLNPHFLYWLFPFTTSLSLYSTETRHPLCIVPVPVLLILVISHQVLFGHGSNYYRSHENVIPRNVWGGHRPYITELPGPLIKKGWGYYFFHYCKLIDSPIPWMPSSLLLRTVQVHQRGRFETTED